MANLLFVYSDVCFKIHSELKVSQLKLAHKNVIEHMGSC